MKKSVKRMDRSPWTGLVSGPFEHEGPGAEEKVRRTYDRAVSDFLGELDHIYETRGELVPGSPRPEYDTLLGDSSESVAELTIAGQQVMQRWETPLMRELARLVCGPGDKVYEVGFGMGISATAIQEYRPAMHVICEANESVFGRLQEWAKERPSVVGINKKWEDDHSNKDVFDGVLYDAYPQSEEDFVRDTVERPSWVAPFFPRAAELLHFGGRFVYFTDEVDSLSRGHQRALLEHFNSFSVHILRGLKPPDDCNYWWWDRMAVVVATK